MDTLLTILGGLAVACVGVPFDGLAAAVPVGVGVAIMIFGLVRECRRPFCLREDRHDQMD